jgi:hypothetical protein
VSLPGVSRPTVATNVICTPGTGNQVSWVNGAHSGAIRYLEGTWQNVNSPSLREHVSSPCCEQLGQ